MRRLVLVISIVSVLVVAVVPVGIPAFPMVNSCVAAMMGYAGAEAALEDCMAQYAHLNLASNCLAQQGQVAFYLDQMGIYCDFEG